MNRREFFKRGGAFVVTAAFCGVTQIPEQTKAEYGNDRCICREQIKAGDIDASGGMCEYCWDRMNRCICNDPGFSPSGGFCKFCYDNTHVNVGLPETVKIMGNRYTVQEMAKALSTPLHVNMEYKP
jgi:hypothetical protein